MAEEKVTDASQKTSSQENKRQAPWVEGKTHRDTPQYPSFPVKLADSDGFRLKANSVMFRLGGL